MWATSALGRARLPDHRLKLRAIQILAQKAARIGTLVAYSSAVAVRLLQIAYWARTEPTRPCTEVLSDDEWRVLWARIHNARLPEGQGPPTMREAVRMIGRLGGHLGRQCDGLPGVRSLWKGWYVLRLLVEGHHIRI